VSARGRDAAEWERKKREVGSRSWTALFQGKPSPGLGNVFLRDWWQFYDTPQWIEREDGSRWAIGFDEVVQSWDMAFKDTAGTDYVVGQVWGRRGLSVYLLDQVRDRLGFVATTKAVRALSARWPQATAKYVEDKANGPAVINALRQKVAGLVPVEPDGDKLARARAVSPFAEAGEVWLPAFELCPWASDVVEECAKFPNDANDDIVDALSQALNRMLLNPLLLGDILVEEDTDPDDGISMY
jgi:predicted phage terminase large subunit-like protein